MKKIICILTSILIVLVLSGCYANRFHSKTMDDYLEENGISNIHFSESSRLSVYGWELYLATGDINNSYNQETESMDWALGENQNGALTLIYVPNNSKYEIVIEATTFPDVDRVLSNIETYNLSDSKICEITTTLTNNRYDEFQSIYEIELFRNAYFSSISLTSSYLVKVGYCDFNDRIYLVSMISVNNQIVIIAHENYLNNNPRYIDVIELFVIN